MPLSLLELFRLLASFSPPRVSLRGAPWEQYVDWAIANGLAPLAAYNLEYRFAGEGAPEWARDRLLSVYQGSVNDNVMKLVSFKRAVDDLLGRRLLLLGGASFAETLYPHVAFRPVPEIRIRVERADLEPFVGYLQQHEYRSLPDTVGLEGAERAVTDDHTPILLYTDLLGPGFREEERALVDRALPVKVYGPSVFRPALEDALLLVCLEQARAGFDVPMLSFVDLRELVLGSPSMAGAYARPHDASAVRERAAAWGLERAVYAALSIVERLFPETRPAVAKARPELRATTRTLLDRVVVGPLSELGRIRVTRGAERLRRLLTGGR
jgi:Uncharacterised nucleotidyltransferase